MTMSEQKAQHVSSARSDRADETADTILTVKDLRVAFDGDDRRVVAVDGISFSVQRGKTLGIVGESGSGKSVTSLAVMRLLPADSARISGTVDFDGRELLSEEAHEMRNLRGNRIAMIFQEPMTSLNPSYTVGEQIVEVIMRHKHLSRRDAAAHAVEMLRQVKMPSPETRFHQYPHNLSGGMRQRVMIAMALACGPELLIADEPTTALDVTIQAQMLNLMHELQQSTGTAIVLITHDLGVVAEACDEVMVMYAGQVVETCSVEKLFAFPQHPYTVGLLGSLPRHEERRERLVAIQGTVPTMSPPPPGCRFYSRCPFKIEKCLQMPELMEIAPGHFSRCWRAPLEDIVT
jgi:peptide/nickel transport system ATP-binding protein